MSKPPGTSNDYSASDVLAPQFWTGKAERLSPGIDVACTKIAVDLQNLTRDGAEECIARCLDVLRDAASADAAFTAFFNAEGTHIESVLSARGHFAQCHPEALKGAAVTSLPWLAQRSEHLRLSEYRDTASPRTEQAEDASSLAELAIGAALLVSFRIHEQPAGFLALGYGLPRGAFDVNLQLLMKLLGSSLASGLERVRQAVQLARLSERNALAERAANDGLWDFDVENNDVYFSPRWRAMLGYDEADLKGGFDWRSLVHPDDISRVQTAIRDHVAGKSPMFESVHRMRHRNGEWRWVISRAQAQLDAHGRLVRLVGVELDITERKLYEEALFREKESAQITLQSIGDGVITTDAASVIDYINPVAEQLTGWRLEDAMGRAVEEIFRAFHEETCEPLENPLTVSIRRARPIKSVRPMLLIRRDGNELYVESTASPIRAGNGKVGGGVLVFHDVSESRELNRRLSYHASHDLLTGLVNRREFENRLERSLKSAKARESSYALCYLDLDQFKIVNDTCGHSAGDALLGQVGALLKSKVRWRDTLSRLGGDEFGILLESCSLDEALRMAESVREAVRAFRFSWEERVFRLGASIGVVPITADNEDVASILSAADAACAAAKEQGRNRVHSFAENDIELMRRRREMQWAARINAALEEGRFELFRMPIQALQKPETGAHYELLLRMRDEQGRIVAPDTFIAAAERYGITPNIDRWVIENALRWLVSEADERERLTMCSINLSGQSLGDDKFLPFVIEQFHKSGLDASKICFEITETAAVQSFSQANRFIQALRELGCKFALDDFGTGLSSFGYLKHFPVDFLKIDGSFVREILHDPIDREMVRSINEIGHLTGKQTIAEFAENAEIIQMLTNIGIDYAQGYGVAQPQRLLKSVSAAPAAPANPSTT
ncbi:MAG TPA: EAL domain-containing protein [Steroidobacteraceae bacterium]|jgi:diguanylate cyclase (GGDEF)-like protein/PAS domain S-box-containing protein|nr:EAL domain-containing protein [Steroidobacteraceae bacterium]